MGWQEGTYRDSESGSAALPQGQDTLLKLVPLQSPGERPQTPLNFGS